MYPNATHGTSSVIWLAHQSPTVGDAEALIRGEFPNLPGNATVLNAYMRAYYYYNDNVTTGTYNVGVYQLAGSWTEGGATWNNSKDLEGENSWIYVAYTSAANSATINAPKPINVPMTSLMQGWANGSTTNHGVKLKYESGTNRSVCFRSSESGSAYSPRFFITYETRILDDGVYTLTNRSNRNIASYNSYNAGYSVSQMSSPTEFTEEHMFKFKCIGNIDGEPCYTIRPMMNNGLVLSNSNGGAVMESAGEGTNVSNSILASQRWIVVYEDGAYRICDESGKYLAVPSGVESNLITTATSSANAAWIFNKQIIDTNEIVFVEQNTEIQLPTQDEYKFTAVVRSYKKDVNGPVRYYVVDEEGNPTDKAEFRDNGNSLTACEPGIVKVLATAGEGIETACVYAYLYYSSVTVDCYYDNGYAARFANAQNRISNAVRELQRFFLNDYGAYIDFVGIHEFASYADRCPEKGGDYESCCECGNGGCTNNIENQYGQDNGEGAEAVVTEFLHHKNIYNIFYDFISTTPSNNIKIAFIGHKTCRMLNMYTHLDDSSIAGLGNIGKEAACVADRTNDVSHETYVLIHEFGHLLGLEDHYDNTPNDNDTNKTLDEMNNGDVNGPYKANCMYGEQWDSNAWQFDLTLCDGCREFLNDCFGVGGGE